MDTDNSREQRETVLVVDDEPIVLSIVSSILEHGGFGVLRAASPGEALRIALDHHAPISLLLCDVVMPGQSGPTVADQFALIHPETVCLFMAGHPEGSEVVDRVIARGRAFLPKPFVPQTLIAKVREVLSNSSRSMAAPA